MPTQFAGHRGERMSQVVYVVASPGFRYSEYTEQSAEIHAVFSTRALAEGYSVKNREYIIGEFKVDEPEVFGTYL